MEGMLKLLHPFMPFITEEIWQVLTDGRSMLILETYPTYDEKIDFSAEERDFEKVISAIKAVRNVRTEMNVPPSVKAKLFIETAEPQIYNNCSLFFEKLASASAIETGSSFEHENCANAVTDSARIFIPLDELVDKEKELARLDKERARFRRISTSSAESSIIRALSRKLPHSLSRPKRQSLQRQRRKWLRSCSLSRHIRSNFRLKGELL